jgi:hypothetical protein
LALCWPVSSVAVAQRGASEGLPTSDQILSKYEEALGGAAALRKVVTRTATTRRIVETGPVSDHILTRHNKLPMLSIMSHRALDGTFLDYNNGCDGTSGWQGTDEGATRTATTSIGGTCEYELYFYGYLPLDIARMKTIMQRLEVKSRMKLVPFAPGRLGELAGGQGPDLVPAGARDVYLTLLVPARKPDPFSWLYFDVQTGALLRREEAGSGAAPGPPGDNPRTTDFLQYRSVGGGTRMPFQFVSQAATVVRAVHVRVVDNEPIDGAVFLRPKNVKREDKGL